MDKMMIYPYSKSYEPYVRNPEVLGEYTITALVSPRGWGYEGDVIEDRQKKEYVVSAEFSKNLDDCSCVWFVSDGRIKLQESLLKEKLIEAINHGKRILYTRYGDENYEKMKELIPVELYIEENVNRVETFNLLQDRIYDIDTPVIVVVGTASDTDKLAVQLALKHKFEEKGYDVTVISSRQDGDWECVYSIPGFMFDYSVSEAEKIIKLNHYVKRIENSEHSDLLILGVPGAVLPLDGINHNDFGILAYEMSFAVPGDAAVLCMMYSPQFEGNYEQFSEDMENRFGFPVTGVHIAATVMDTQEFFEEKKMSPVSIDVSLVDQKISEINKNTIWNLLSEQGMEQAVSVLIDVLSD